MADATRQTDTLAGQIDSLQGADDLADLEGCQCWAIILSFRSYCRRI